MRRKPRAMSCPARVWGVGHLLLFLAIAWAGVASANSELPPLGQRKYVIETKDPYAPVAIQSADREVRQVYLKDPIQSVSKVDYKPLKPLPRRKVAEQKKREPKAVRLSFKPLPVNGRVAKPRVEFTRDLLEVPLADEPVTGSFFEKVFAPISDQDF